MADLPWDDIEAWLEVRDATQIADDIRDYAAAKVAEERERCARLVEATLPTAWPKEVAAAIRGTEAASRGET